MGNYEWSLDNNPTEETRKLEETALLLEGLDYIKPGEHPKERAIAEQVRKAVLSVVKHRVLAVRNTLYWKHVGSQPNPFKSDIETATEGE